MKRTKNLIGLSTQDFDIFHTIRGDCNKLCWETPPSSLRFSVYICFRMTPRVLVWTSCTSFLTLFAQYNRVFYFCSRVGLFRCENLHLVTWQMITNSKFMNSNERWSKLDVSDDGKETRRTEGEERGAEGIREHWRRERGGEEQHTVPIVFPPHTFYSWSSEDSEDSEFNLSHRRDQIRAAPPRPWETQQPPLTLSNKTL